MTDTVFILGAGFSYDAGIPLLGRFIETMNDYALRRKSKQGPLDPADLKIFLAAQSIRNDLDVYHARANFRSRNIEDILSILSFESIGSTSSNMQKMVAAIAKTIDLSCVIRPPHKQNRGHVTYGQKDEAVPLVYMQFWKALFEARRKGYAMPGLITFNYDLVLERSFVNTWAGRGVQTSENVPPFEVVFKYHYPPVQDASFFLELGREFGESRIPYTYVSEAAMKNRSGVPPVEIDLLKLHGSVNFPAMKKSAPTPERHFLEVVPEPFLLPPVFNKMSSRTPTAMWRRALTLLKGAKHVVVVGYSLPSTDIYMQYFLKAALGPNQTLERITVFDPVLWTKGDDDISMRRRYVDCFSEEIRNHIVFNPPGNAEHGTLKHLVAMLANEPGNVLW